MGFGRELKDFLGAYQAGIKINGASDDAEYKVLRNKYLKSKVDDALDPDMRQAKINRLNRGFKPVDPDVTALRRARTLDVLEQTRQRKLNGQAPAGPADGAEPYAAPPSRGGVTKPQSALPVDEPVQTSSLDPDDEEDDDVQPVAVAARGGVITQRQKYTKGYAAGGVVEGDDDEEETPEVDTSGDEVDPVAMDREDAADDAEGPQSAVPAAGAKAAAPAPSGKTMPYSNQAAHDAVVAGVKYAAKELGHTDDGKSAVTTEMSARAAGSHKYLKGEGAASHDEMVKVGKAVDPEGKMSESERTMASLATVYEWKLKNNDPSGADRAAASMVQYYRQVSDRYKAMSAAAAEHGDVDGAIKMALRAHANVPDGKDMKLEPDGDGKIKYSMTDVQTGKVIEQQVATPEQILEFASKGSMHTFDDLLVRSSADRAQAGKKDKKGTAGYKAKDRETADTAVDASVSDLPDQGESIKDQKPEIKGTAFQLQAANQGISKNDALRATMEMTQVDEAGLKKPSFAALPDKQQDPKSGAVKFQLSNGQVVSVPEELIPRLAKQRNANVAALTKKLEGAKASAGRTSENIDAAKTALTPDTTAISSSPAMRSIRDKVKAIGEALPSVRGRGAIDPQPESSLRYE